MFNVLLDELPTEYMGFPIDTDFGIGIQIMQVLENEDLSQQERTGKALSLLFITEDEEGNPLPVPDINTALEGMKWFLTDWYHDKPNEKDKVKVTDYNIDQWRIYSGFRQHYGINLQTDSLHFWEFMALLTTLPECAYTRVIDIRNRKITPKMSAEEKSALKEAKKIYALDALEEELTDSEKEAVEAFMALVRKGKK